MARREEEVGEKDAYCEVKVMAGNLPVIWQEEEEVGTWYLTKKERRKMVRKTAYSEVKVMPGTWYLIQKDRRKMVRRTGIL